MGDDAGGITVITTITRFEEKSLWLRDTVMLSGAEPRAEQWDNAWWSRVELGWVAR